MDNEILTKKYRNEVKEHKKTKKTLEAKNLDYILLEEKYNAVLNTNEELENRLKEYQKGGIMFTKYPDTNYISTIKIFPNDHETTFYHDIPQELSKALGTLLYNKYPFGIIENGIIGIDTDQYKKYIGGL